MNAPRPPEPTRCEQCGAVNAAVICTICKTPKPEYLAVCGRDRHQLAHPVATSTAAAPTLAADRFKLTRKAALDIARELYKGSIYDTDNLISSAADFIQARIDMDVAEQRTESIAAFVQTQGVIIAACEGALKEIRGS